MWDGRVELVDWQVPATVRRGADFEVSLTYRVLAPLDRSWRIFVHLDGPRFRLNVDHEPLAGQCPMSAWRPGDRLVDRYTARFPADYPPGEYTLWTGFFLGWADRWINLPVSAVTDERRGKNHRVKVATIRVE